MKNPFDSIASVVADLRQGKMVVIVDDADRENEGDLILAAEKATPKNISFLVRYTSGVLRVPMAGADLDRLQLPLMTGQQADRMRTAYTISVDAARGISSGISAADRAHTIRLLANPATRAEDLVRPGQVFPLRYRDGGVLRRAGHTEAGVDLARLAGLQPAAVIAEIVNDDGSLARLPALRKFARQHKLKIGTISDLIEYRRTREKLVEKLETIKLPTDYGDFTLHLYRSRLEGEHHLALVRGDVAGGKNVLVRVHSECLTGDVFGSRRGPGETQLHRALRQVAAADCGVILYMRPASGGPGLPLPVAADKVGNQMDLREYGLGAQILCDLGLKTIRLLTNHPRKIVGLEGYGLKITQQIPLARKPAAAPRVP